MVFSNAYTQTENLLQLSDLRKSIILEDPKNMPGFDKFEDRNSIYKRNLNNQDVLINTYSGEAPGDDQLAIVKNVIIEDFLVNDDLIGGATQYSPSIAMDGVGNFVITWFDERNGNWDIYFQCYDKNGTTKGKNTKVNDDFGISIQYAPSIAMDYNGNFVIVWYDYRNGNTDIYFQCYNSFGTSLGSNKKSNDDKGIANQYSPSVAMNDFGNYVIVWQDYRNGNKDIYFQQYNVEGKTIGVNTKANDNIGKAESPSIDIDNNDNFVIVWKDYRNSDSDIYYQQIDSSGKNLGENKKVNDDINSESQYAPTIAMNNSGNFVIVWMDNRYGNSDIYYQLFNWGGTAQGINKKINDDTDNADQYAPSIAMDNIGNFVVAWYDGRHGNWDIYYQHYDINGTGQGVNETAKCYYGTIDSPSIASDGNGNFVIVWDDNRNFNSDIYYQRFNNFNTSIGVNSKVNDDYSSSDQNSLTIAMGKNGDFVIVWVDFRNGNRDIYFQRYSENGNAQGENTKVNDDISSTWQLNPSIAMDGNGNFVIVWQDERDNITKIYYQCYDSYGNKLGVNKKADYNVNSASERNPSIAMDVKGNFVIVWENNLFLDTDIYYQKFNRDGIAQGESKKVNNNSGKYVDYFPSIAMDSSGNFIILWQDYMNGKWDILYQRLNNSGTAQGINIKVCDDSGSSGRYPLKVSLNDNGKFIVVWYDIKNENSDIYFQIFDNNGLAQGVKTKANNDVGPSKQTAPAIAMDKSGNFVIAWQDYKNITNNPDIIGQRFYADGSLNGENYRIVADGPNYGEASPVVAANNDKITFAWMDNRLSKGWDIYGKIVGWDWDGVTSITENEVSFSKDFKLINNFPNPFYNQTSFEYLIGNKSNIDVSVFDIHGNKIRTILKESQDTGRHSIIWDGKNNNGNNVNNGVYLVRFSSSTFQVFIKTILLK